MSTTVTDWRPARAIPHLADNALHIWLALADEHGPSLPRYTRHLSPDELRRAGRMRRLKLQERFIISRGLLRALLSRYLECRPELIQFACSLQGKPYLPASVSSGQLQFNLSHSRDAIVFAVRLHEPVGIDVEYMRDNLDFTSLARRFFSNQEYRDISTLAGLEQRTAFYTYWTRKEAYLKATGKGLAGLREAVAADMPEEKPDTVKKYGLQSADECWSVIDLTIPEPAYAGAVAFAGGPAKIEALLLTPDNTGI
jgi:4'-phosphopantetheinyl transferase